LEEARKRPVCETEYGKTSLRLDAVDLSRAGSDLSAHLLNPADPATWAMTSGGIET